MSTKTDVGRRGRVCSQIIEGARNNLDLLDNVDYGTVIFHVKGNNVWRLEVTISKMLDDSIRKEKL